MRFAPQGSGACEATASASARCAARMDWNSYSASVAAAALRVGRPRESFAGRRPSPNAASSAGLRPGVSSADGAPAHQSPGLASESPPVSEFDIPATLMDAQQACGRGRAPAKIVVHVVRVVNHVECFDQSEASQLREHMQVAGAVLVPCSWHALPPARLPFCRQSLSRPEEKHGECTVLVFSYRFFTQIAPPAPRGEAGFQWSARADARSAGAPPSLALLPTPRSSLHREKWCIPSPYNSMLNVYVVCVCKV